MREQTKHAAKSGFPQMGKYNVYKDKVEKRITIFAHLYCYGGKSSPELASQMAEDLQYHWSRPKAVVLVDKVNYTVAVSATGEHADASAIWGLMFGNRDYKKFFIRVEDVIKNIEMDISNMSKPTGSNTGVFKYDNVKGRHSTTEAHEIGTHGWGGGHPTDGNGNAIYDATTRGQPGINFPRGTRVDKMFQYNPKARAGDGNNGGTLNPEKRLVIQQDVELLGLDRLAYDGMDRACLGGVTNEFFFGNGMKIPLGSGWWPRGILL
jgi:hypothetical protein